VDAPLTNTLITALNTQLSALFSQYRPASAVFVGDIKSVADVNTLPDLNTLSARRVHVSIAQDGGAEGLALYNSQPILTRKTVGAVGTILGLLSRTPISESISYVAKNNIVIDSEFEVLAFGNGELYKTKNITQLNALASKNYSYFRKDPSGQSSGSWHSDTYTATSRTDDFNDLNRNLVIDELCRVEFTVMFQNLNSGLLVQPNGKLKPQTIDYFTNLIKNILLDFEGKNYIQEVIKDDIYINPNQNVLATSKIEIRVFARPIGVARKIEINNSYNVISN
jgi:hypothetical protein